MIPHRLAAILAHTTAIIRSRAAYNADRNVANGRCAVCAYGRIVEGHRVCGSCRYRGREEAA